MEVIILSALEEDGIISKSSAKEIRKVVSNTKKKVSEILIEKGVFGNVSYCEWVKRKFGVDIWNEEMKPDTWLVKLFPKELIEESFFVPIGGDEDKLFIASPEPFDVPVKKITEITGVKKVEVFVCSPEFVRKSIAEAFGDNPEPQTEEKMEKTGVETVKTGADEVLNYILRTSISKSATDIHIIPSPTTPKIKIRVNGRLTELITLSHLTSRILTNKIKVLSSLDISEKRLPQDGRFSYKNFDIRVSVIPTIHGEKVAMRILRKSFDFSLKNIGLNDVQISYVMDALNKQSGFIFVAGPTGSGKTTTLYSMLLEINRDELNVFSVEDPVEYFLPSVNQVQINEEIGLSFPKALKHILRQDPDVIFIGEIRDPESADIALKSALTGHLVLTSVHAKDTASAIVRFLDLGIPDYILLSALSLGISQRLVRVLCPECKGRRCAKCSWQGYSGREGIFEVVKFSDDMKLAIKKGRRTEEEIRDMFRSKGIPLLYEQGMRKVKEGKVREEEIRFVL